MYVYNIEYWLLDWFIEKLSSVVTQYGQTTQNHC